MKRTKPKPKSFLFAASLNPFLDGNYSTARNVENDTYAEFDVTGLNKGIYTVTLSVDGKNIETTKTILK